MIAPYYREAIATATAPRWKLCLARMFGTRVIGWDSRYQVTMAEWRGVRYLLTFHERQDVSGGGR